jgi:hypothetical protein
MPSDSPIACSLSPAELPQRLAEMSAIGRTSRLTTEINGRSAVLRFRIGARNQLDAIVAAEAQCCAFLSMQLEDEPDAVRLTIEAPPGAEPVLHDLAAAFGGSEQAV